MLKLTWKDSAGIDKEILYKDDVRINKEIVQIKQAQKKGYSTEFASINLPFDTEIIERVSGLAQKFQQDGSCAIAIVIGIGGSSLGARAVHEALNGLLYNTLTGGIKLYFAESTDPDYISDLHMITEKELSAGKNIVLIVISKSGTTLETMANFAIFCKQLIKYRPEHFNKYIVVITDENSDLAKQAVREKYHLLEIPKLVGGRYSVFSAVGLFPLALVGVDICALRAGAADMVQLCLHEDLLSNPAAVSALFLYYWYDKGYNIHDSFFFSQQLASVGAWYRQLMAESLGKKSTHGKWVGITPTVSIGSTDLHSIAQLYLGGPYDKITTFVSCKQYAHTVIVPDTNRSLQDILHAILHGVERAYTKSSRPYISYELDAFSAYDLGQLLQMNMIQVMYLGALLEVNPFDQPQVELYKKEIKLS